MIEEDEDELDIKYSFELEFDDPRLKEKVRKITENIFIYQHEIKGKVTRKSSKKGKYLFLEAT